MSITNNSAEELDYNVINFSGQTKDGVDVTYGDALMTILPDDQYSLDALSAGTLMPGNFVEGYITFPVSDNSYIKTLEYSSIKNSFKVVLPEL